MSKRILLILSHSIEEHDQLKLLSSLGYEVFSLGGYINPHAPHDPKRPALPEVPHFPELQAVVDGLGTDDNIGNAAKRIPPDILDWLGADGTIICHHYLERVYGQWEHLQRWRRSGGRVVWRTVGQSTTDNEKRASYFHADGLEIIRYSPNERFIPGYAGANGLIRFYKDPDEWSGWNGEGHFVTNITQELLRRDPWCNAGWYLRATQDVPARPAGQGSELLPGGYGELPFEEVKQLLRDARCYVYTGTQPASYTLGFIEALMTGTPIVSIGPERMTLFPYGAELFEACELAPLCENEPHEANRALRALIEDSELATRISTHQRWRAVQMFGIEKVGADWKEYLG